MEKYNKKQNPERKDYEAMLGDEEFIKSIDLAKNIGKKPKKQTLEALI